MSYGNAALFRTVAWWMLWKRGALRDWQIFWDCPIPVRRDRWATPIDHPELAWLDIGGEG